MRPIAFSDQWEPLVAITGDRSEFYERYEEATRDKVLEFLTHDLQNASSIVSCLSKARENARSTREVISSDVWEQINRFYLLVSNHSTQLRSTRDAFAFYSEVKLIGNLMAGVADNTMSHDEAWHFFRLGKMIERADNTSRLLDVKYFLLLPSIEGRRRAGGRDAVDDGARFGVGAGDVPQAFRPGRARERGRLPAPRPGFPALGAVLPCARG